MLVVVESNNAEKNRQLVPFTKGYCQVMFPSVGVNTVHVTGVWGRSKRLEETFMKKERGQYQTDVLETHQPKAEVIERMIQQVQRSCNMIKGKDPLADFRRRGYWNRISELGQRLKAQKATEAKTTVITSFNGVSRLDFEATDSVEVDEAMFATHWRITKWLANLYPYFKQRTSPDGCSDRKRAYVYAAPTLWVYALYLLAKSIGAIGIALTSLFFGFRGINFMPVYKPHGRVPFDVWRNVGNTVWWNKSDGTGRDLHPLVIMNPPLVALSGVLAALSTAIWARALNPKQGWTDRFVQMWTDGPWWFYVVVVLGPVIVVAAVLAVVGLGYALGLVRKVPTVSHIMQWWWARQRARRQAKWEKYYARVAKLTCGTGEVLKKPAPRKPILLRPIEAGKMRVCRPNPR